VCSNVKIQWLDDVAGRLIDPVERLWRKRQVRDIYLKANG
jgi:hypothetical protein